MKLLLLAVLVWCGAVCAPADEYAFPGEREWISKLGDVVKGSFQSCTGSRLALKTGRKRVEIPLNRLDEEDAALAASLTGTAARRDLKLAAMPWPCPLHTSKAGDDLRSVNTGGSHVTHKKHQ